MLRFKLIHAGKRGPYPPSDYETKHISCGVWRIGHQFLTHWGRVTHICVGNLTIIGSDNGLSPGRRQAIIWTNAGILLVGPLGKNFNKILIEIHIISFKKSHLKMSSGKRRPSCLGLNVLSDHWIIRDWWWLYAFTCPLKIMLVDE